MTFKYYIKQAKALEELINQKDEEDVILLDIIPTYNDYKFVTLYYYDDIKTQKLYSAQYEYWNSSAYSYVSNSVKVVFDLREAIKDDD